MGGLTPAVDSKPRATLVSNGTGPLVARTLAVHAHEDPPGS